MYIAKLRLITSMCAIINVMNTILFSGVRAIRCLLMGLAVFSNVFGHQGSLISGNDQLKKMSLDLARRHMTAAVSQVCVCEAQFGGEF